MKTITGKWNYTNGSPAANATLTLVLAAEATTGSIALAPKEIQFTLDDTGSIPAGTQIWASDELEGTNTDYIVSVVTTQNGRIWGQNTFAIAGTSPINLNLLAP